MTKNACHVLVSMIETPSLTHATVPITPLLSVSKEITVSKSIYYYFNVNMFQIYNAGVNVNYTND